MKREREKNKDWYWWCRTESQEQIDTLLKLAKETSCTGPHQKNWSVGYDFLFLDKCKCIDLWPYTPSGKEDRFNIVSFSEMCSLMKGEEVERVMKDSVSCKVTEEQIQRLEGLKLKASHFYNAVRDGCDTVWLTSSGSKDHFLIGFYRAEEILHRSIEEVSFEEVFSHVSLLSGVKVMKDFVVDAFCVEGAECLVAMANKAGVKVDANRPYSATNHMCRLSGGVVSFGTWTKTGIFDDAVTALSKPALLLGKLPATVDGNNIVVDESGTKHSFSKAELKSAYEWLKGKEVKGFKVGFVTKKNGDAVVPVGLQVGCQLFTVEQIEAVLA